MKGKKRVETPDSEVAMGYAEGIKEEAPVIQPADPGKYFIVTFGTDFRVKELPGDISEQELYSKYIRKSGITPPFKIYKGVEIKIRR